MSGQSPFDKFWVSPENPANRMPAKTRDQIKWHFRQCFNAGMKAAGVIVDDDEPEDNFDS